MRDEVKVEDLRKLCESPFECDVYDCLTERGYCVTPQVPVGQYRIDMVVEGANDARLAIECDGDRYHGPDKWAEDMHRQRVLERAGWVFWRCFASAWIRRRDELLQNLLSSLYQHGIEPSLNGNAGMSVYTEQRRVLAVEQAAAVAGNE
jgi:very-short-patch-repair endonuclease